MFHAGDPMVKKDLVNINIKVPLTLKQILERYVKLDLHTNLSEFTRDALRERARLCERSKRELATRANQNSQVLSLFIISFAKVLARSNRVASG